MKWIFALASTLFGVLLHAPEVIGQELPSLIRNDLLSELRTCEPPVRTISPASIRIVDFNGDGKPDFIIDYGELCDTFCGTGGCTHDMWVSTSGNTWIRAFSDNIRSIERTVTRQGRAVLLVDMHGSACNRMGASPCPKQIRWDGSSLSLEPR